MRKGREGFIYGEEEVPPWLLFRQVYCHHHYNGIVLFKKWCRLLKPARHSSLKRKAGFLPPKTLKW
jgi:hypothetical protein